MTPQLPLEMINKILFEFKGLQHPVSSMFKKEYQKTPYNGYIDYYTYSGNKIRRCGITLEDLKIYGRILININMTVSQLKEYLNNNDIKYKKSWSKKKLLKACYSI